MTCTRCAGTGFINTHQIGEAFDTMSRDEVLSWISTHVCHDVQVCDCCGNGDVWYGEPGQHYGPEDPQGDRGPYHYNGGYCECH